MDRETLDAVEVQTGAAEQLDQRMRGEVAEVLVVDRVELCVLDEVAQVGDLDDRDAIVFEDRLDPAHEAVGVGDVGQHVVAVDDAGAYAVSPESPGELLGEELVVGRDPLLPSRFDRALRGVDACTLMPRAA